MFYQVLSELSLPGLASGWQVSIEGVFFAFIAAPVPAFFSSVFLSSQAFCPSQPRTRFSTRYIPKTLDGCTTYYGLS